MLDSQTEQGARILTDRRVHDLPQVASLIKSAAAREGISPGRIFREMIALGARRRGLTQHEYFGYHLYRKELTIEQKREFVGEAGNYHLNLQLSPPTLTNMRGFLRDKLAHGALWRQWEIPTARMQALFSRDRWAGPIPVLRNADAIVSFLSQDARFPVFGKPFDGLQAVGSVRIDSVTPVQDAAQLADGRVVSISALAEEIARDYPDGYLFQDVVEQHPEVTAVLGPTLSAPRLVTVIPDDKPEMLYSYWKIASPKAMSDNFWQEGSMLARIDIKTGTVQNCIVGKGPEVQDVEQHPVTGKPIVGFQIPHWQEAVEMVRHAHSIFPINGCLGWDIGFGAEGPVLMECNENPGHDTYQIVLGRGMLNPEFKAIFDRVMARNQRISAEKKARVYKVKH